MNKHKSFAAVGAVLLLSAAVALGAPQLSLRMQENKLFGSAQEADSISAAVKPQSAHNYVSLVAELSPTASDLSYLKNLMKKGYDVNALYEIYKFWRDTAEDIEIIEEVYKFKPESPNVMYWVDEAFIELANQGKTKNQYSNLSVEEVEAYKNSGMTFSDILVADKLSRYGTEKIETILDEKQSGVSWFEITDNVYSISSPEEKTANAEKYKNISDPYEILDSIALSKKSGKSATEYLDAVICGESSSEILLKDELTQKTVLANELASSGIISEEEKNDIISAAEGGDAE